MHFLEGSRAELILLVIRCSLEALEIRQDVQNRVYLRFLLPFSSSRRK